MNRTHLQDLPEVMARITKLTDWLSEQADEFPNAIISLAMHGGPGVIVQVAKDGGDYLERARLTFRIARHLGLPQPRPQGEGGWSLGSDDMFSSNEWSVFTNRRPVTQAVEP